MSRGGRDAAVAVGLVAAGVAMVVAPAVAVQWGLLHDGVGSLDDDILLASVAVAGVHAALAWPRLRAEERHSRTRAHLWIAGLDGLVVLALSATLVLLAVLVAFPDEHLTLDHHGFPVVLMWGGIQLVAVLLAEATARLTFRWLEPQAA